MSFSQITYEEDGPIGWITMNRPENGNMFTETMCHEIRDCIEGIRRESKPGRRVYVGHNEIPRVMSGLGMSILSTSHGLMTDREARSRKVGGELLCYVW